MKEIHACNTIDRTAAEAASFSLRNYTTCAEKLKAPPRRPPRFAAPAPPAQNTELK